MPNPSTADDTDKDMAMPTARATRERRIYWRCFHCGEAFTKAQARWARQHFGADETALPVCQMRVPGEHHLLEYLRKAELDLDFYRQEDTELHRAIHAMAADHATKLRKAEEEGYHKGLIDGRQASGEGEQHDIG